MHFAYVCAVDVRLPNSIPSLSVQAPVRSPIQSQTCDVRTPFLSLSFYLIDKPVVAHS